MIDTFRMFIVYVATKIYTSPVVKKVIKKSIMGNYFDKTIEYYTGNISPSFSDEHHSIEYVYKNQNYIVVCDDEEAYKKSVDYINNFGDGDCEDKIIAAFHEENGTYKNITELVKKFQGPEKNFYEGSIFQVKKHYITENMLYIVDKEFNCYQFTHDDDIISLQTTHLYLNLSNNTL